MDVDPNAVERAESVHETIAAAVERVRRQPTRAGIPPLP
jgi:hypothetical protein